MDLVQINTQIRYDSNQSRRKLDLHIQKFTLGESSSMSRWGGMQRFRDVIFFALSAYLPLWASGISIFGFTDILLSA
jgi:hypothetical protein